jgi:hypothetical protein
LDILEAQVELRKKKKKTIITALKTPGIQTMALLPESAYGGNNAHQAASKHGAPLTGIPSTQNPIKIHVAEPGMEHHEHGHAYEMADVVKAAHREEVPVAETQTHQHALWKCVVTALMYGVVSSLMTFCNKALSSSYNFSYPLFLLGVQMATTQAGLCLLHLFRAQTSIFLGFSFEYPSITLKGLLLHIPVASLYVLNATLAISSLQGMSIPT